MPQIRKWLAGLDPRPELFIEPFVGGGIASLTAVMDGYVDRALLCDKDPELSNLWQCILDDTDRLAKQVESFTPTPDDVRAVFNDDITSDFESAFRTLLRNRVNRGGIIAKGASTMNKGENGNGLASRWYAKTLASRIRTIGSYARHFEFVRGDGIDLIERFQDCQSAVFFIDPPYTAAGKQAGKRLYSFNEIDHESLFERVSAVKAPFMLTYDENDGVVEMAQRHGFHVAKVAMKNTHHAVMYELLITSHELSP